MKEEVKLFLKDKKDALDVESIMSGMGLDSSHRTEIEEVMEELETKDYEVFRTKKHKYILYDNCGNLRRGIIDINKKGNGFLKVDKQGEEDIFIPQEELKYALDGDLAVVEIVEYSSKEDKRSRLQDTDKRSGRVIKVLKRNIDNIVGEIVKNDNNNGLSFKSYDKRKVEFVLDEEALEECVEGEIVALQPLSELSENKYTATIKRKLGHKDDAGMDIKVICAKHEVYDEFPDDVIAQLEDIPSEVRPQDRVGRVDLSDKMIFTIDGKDTKDIDDAISLEMNADGNYVLGVHIADVSYYVEEGSPIDKEALKRGTSCYPPGSVIPMIPHKLSNGICSLNEDVDRCAVTCEMVITPQGRVIASDIYPSIIHSKKKMNYDDVNSVIERDEIPEGYEPYADTLKKMLELAHIIREEREGRGASDFDIKEAKVVCDEYGKPTDIICRDRGEGERLIEDFMIAANEAVARSLYYNHAYGVQLPGVYRVHEMPLPTKIESFIGFLGSMGKQITGSYKKINFKTIKSILSQLEYENETEEAIIKSMAVRSMPKAYYSQDNLGHYGLASKCYSHFTSPIRRYPDTQIHRLIRTFLFENRTDAKTISYYNNLLPDVTRQCSDREVKAAEAERECVKMKMAEYMEDYVGEEYTAVVTGVTSFGMFVQLPNLVEGMVPLTTLDGFYTYNEESQTLTSREGSKFRLGTELEVKCTGASKEAMTVDFEVTKVLTEEKAEVNNNNKKLAKKKHGRGKQ